ncbi:MAG: TrbG/VirB9 family P-type conjugative transfer protein [Alphaproteobacteria bacterium]
MMYLKFINKLFLILVVVLSIGNSYADIPLATDRRIKTYVYNENEVYLLLIRSGFQSSVEFENGEEIKTLSLGDAYSWNITPVGNRMFIKPLEDEVRTNMTVITNKRTYQFDVVSQKSEEDSMDQDISYVVRFYYPLKNEN